MSLEGNDSNRDSWNVHVLTACRLLQKNPDTSTPLVIPINVHHLTLDFGFHHSDSPSDASSQDPWADAPPKAKERGKMAVAGKSAGLEVLLVFVQFQLSVIIFIVCRMVGFKCMVHVWVICYCILNFGIYNRWCSAFVVSWNQHPGARSYHKLLNQ